MKRSEVRAFVQTGVNAITPVLDYWEGEITDFNAQRSNEYPGVLLVLEENDIELTTSSPQDSWKIKLIIANIDKLDSTPEVYEDIIDHCDEVAQKLIYKFRNIVSGYKLITMDSINRKKFIKKYADCLTGIELTFDLHAPDQTIVC
jgi:hypothetical protein